MSTRTSLQWSDGAAGPVLAAVDEPDWRGAALCPTADPEAWFPEKGGSNREAKKICRRCPSRLPCLTSALDNSEQWGTWGGFSERQLRTIRMSGKSAAQVIAEDGERRLQRALAEAARQEERDALAREQRAEAARTRDNLAEAS